MMVNRVNKFLFLSIPILLYNQFNSNQFHMLDTFVQRLCLYTF